MSSAARLYPGQAMKGTAVLVLLPALAGLAGAQTLRAQIDATNKEIGRLMRASDTAGLKRTMKAGVTPDFKYVDEGQTMGFEAMSAAMTAGIGQMKALRRADATLVTLREKGDVATATTRHTMEGTMPGADHKPHTMTFSGTSEERYVRQGGKWKMVRMSWLEQKMALDGKPFRS